jgi:hypothetical protein
LAASVFSVSHRATLLDALRMLNESDFRSSIVDQFEDPVLKQFWTGEYSQYSKGYRTEAIAPIQNKLGEFLINLYCAGSLSIRKATSTPERSWTTARSSSLTCRSEGLAEDISMLLGATLIGVAQGRIVGVTLLFGVLACRVIVGA